MTHIKDTVDIVDVSPVIAVQWLKMNTHNRTLRVAKVAEYARDMTLGRWIFDGSPIRFADDGVLLDGAHRLNAIVKSGTTQRFLVVVGIAKKAQDVMDTGAKRLIGDQLQLRGFENARQVAAIARLCMWYDMGFPGRHSTGGNSYSDATPTNADVYEYIENNHALRDAAAVAQSVSKHLTIPPARFGAMYFLCARVCREDAREFWIEQVAQGLALEVGDPALILRRTYEALRDDDRQSNTVVIFGFGLHAWNKYRKHETVMLLRPPRDGWLTGNIPTPI
jgi:hypothetical protein